LKITNKQNLPEGIVKAVDTERHNKTDKELSATTLLKGAKEIILTWRHWDEITLDAADNIWAIFGTAVHALLEAEGEHDFTECEFTVPMPNGISITGRIDNYNMETEIITDYKTGSIWKVIMGEFDDWRMQGIIYAWLLVKSGFKVKLCRFIDLLKDHSKSKAEFDSKYPQTPVYIYQYPITDAELKEGEAYINERLAEYLKYKDKPDDEIPPCTDKERWASETKYAVMKQGNKRAIKLCASESEASRQVAERGHDKHYVETRPGVSKKCAGYCLCKNFCNFYNNIVKYQEQSEE
jgi:hypothetical protein